MAMNEASDERGARRRGADSGGAGALGGLTMLIALPIGAVTLALGLRGAWQNFGAIPFLFEVVRNGGGFGLGVVAAAVLATIASAVMMSAALRSGALPVPAAVAPFLFALVVAMAGAKAELRVITSALPSAAPEDRATILAAGISELMSLQLLSLAFAFGGVAAGVFACGAGAFHKDPALRRAAGVSALGLAALGASLFALFMASAGLRVGFAVIGYVSPNDRLRVLLTLLEELQPWSSYSAACAVGVLVVAVAGGLWLAREDRRSAIAFAVSLVVALIGFRGTISVTDRVMNDVDVATLSDPAEAKVLVFEGAPMPYATMVYPARLGTDELRDTLEGLQTRVQLWVDQQETREQMVSALQLAHDNGLDVMVMGFAPPQTLPANSPALLKPFLELLNRHGTGAPLRVRFEGDACPDCAGRAVVTPSGLESPGGEMWQPRLLNEVPDEKTLKVLDTEWKGNVEALALAASAALGHGCVLEVSVPRPQSERSEK